jgi:hypothetical protein
MWLNLAGFGKLRHKEQLDNGYHQNAFIPEGN